MYTDPTGLTGEGDGFSFLFNSWLAGMNTNPMSTNPSAVFTRTMGAQSGETMSQVARTSAVTAVASLSLFSLTGAAAAGNIFAKGALTAASVSTGSQLASGKAVDPEEVLLAGGFGALTGAIGDKAVAAYRAGIEGATTPFLTTVLSQMTGRIATSPVTVGSTLTQKAVNESQHQSGQSWISGLMTFFFGTPKEAPKTDDKKGQ